MQKLNKINKTALSYAKSMENKSTFYKTEQIITHEIIEIFTIK